MCMFQIICSYITCISFGAVVLALIFKPIRNFFSWKKSYRNDLDSRFDRLEPKLNRLEESLKLMIDAHNERHIFLKKVIIESTRNKLTLIYHRAVERGFIDMHSKENFLNMYNSIYNELGKNSYLHRLYKQILKMPTHF